MEFRILGPLEVRGHGGAVTPAGAKPRALLAMLLVHANEPVSAERLAIALWGEDAPAGAAKAIQVNVSRLRKALGGDGLVQATPAGYRLNVEPGELDAERFERLVERARSAQPAQAWQLVDEALGLWRGDA